MIRSLLDLNETDTVTRVEFFLRRGWHPALIVLLLAVIVAYAVYIYRRETALGTGLRVVLASLRAVVLALLLLVFLDPVAAVQYEEVQSGNVIVLVDVSQSMGLKDERTDDKQLRALATAAGKLGADAAPTAALPKDVKDEINDTSRFELARAFLSNSAKDMNLLRRLEANNRVRLFTFGKKEEEKGRDPAVEEGEARDPAGAAPAAWLDKVLPDQKFTALGAAIEDAVARYSGQLIAGVVVLTDGASNKGRGPVEVAADMGRRGIAVYPVGLGLPAPNNVELRDVVVQDAVFADDTVPVRVHIVSRGYLEPTVTVRVKLDGEKVASKQVELHEGVQFTSLEFVPKGRSGTVKMTVEVGQPADEGLVPLEGEISEADNKIERTIRVIDEKIRVLYVEGAPRWEYRYLRAVLLRDKRLSVRFLMTEGDPALAKYSPRYLVRFPEEAAAAFGFDLVILGDVRADYLNAAQFERIEQLVRERGGSLLMLAGPLYAPASYADTPVEAMLPVKLAGKGTMLLEPDVHPVPTVSGQRGAVVSLKSDPLDNEKLWSGVRWLHQVPRLGKAKPGADVLLELSATSGGDAYPLVAWQRYGRGKCMFVGTDQLWRLRFKVGDKYHARFWAQAIRFLTLSRLLGANKRVHLQTDRRAYGTQDRVQIFAHVVDEAYELTQSPTFTVTIIGLKVDEGAAEPPPAQTITLEPVDPETPGFFRGTYVAESSGRFAVRPDEKDLRPFASMPEFDVRRISLEMRDPALRERTLREMAAASNGRYVVSDRLKDPDNDAETDLRALPERIKKAERQIDVRTEKDLRDGWPLFALILFCAALEWFLRRRYDLA